MKLLGVYKYLHKDYVIICDTLAFSDGLNDVIPVVCTLWCLCGHTILHFYTLFYFSGGYSYTCSIMYEPETLAAIHKETDEDTT